MTATADHDCRNYPASKCDWCRRASLVRRWWRGVYDGLGDVIPLPELPVEIISAYLDFFDSITSELAQEIRTADDKEQLAELYTVAGLFPR